MSTKLHSGLGKATDNVDPDLTEESELSACAVATSQHAPVEDEPSIDEYFASMMTRIGANIERMPAIETVVERAPKVAPVPMAAESQLQADRGHEPSDAVALDKLPRRETPQTTENLTSMRELAMSSAHQAIGSSHAKNIEQTFRDLMFAGGSLAAAIVLLSLSSAPVSIPYGGALVTIGLAVGFGVRFISRIRAIDAIDAIQGRAPAA